MPPRRRSPPGWRRSGGRAETRRKSDAVATLPSCPAFKGSEKSHMLRSTTLSNGLRVRLRLSRPSDRTCLRALCAQLGLQADDLVLSRLVRYDPRERTAICAAVFNAGTEAIVGYGAIDRFADSPDLLLVDEDAAPGMSGILGDALREQAARHVA